MYEPHVFTVPGDTYCEGYPGFQVLVSEYIAPNGARLFTIAFRATPVQTWGPPLEEDAK